MPEEIARHWHPNFGKRTQILTRSQIGPNFAMLVIEWANVQKRDILRRLSMKVNQGDRLLRNAEFEANHNRLRAHQMETMIAEFDRMCVDLGQQIEAEEARVRIHDQTHFAYPNYAKAARERQARLERSANALGVELDKLRFVETYDGLEGQFAA
jgi:hypothetical protein